MKLVQFAFIKAEIKILKYDGAVTNEWSNDQKKLKSECNININIKLSENNLISFVGIMSLLQA